MNSSLRWTRFSFAALSATLLGCGPLLAGGDAALDGSVAPDAAAAPDAARTADAASDANATSDAGTPLDTAAPSLDGRAPLCPPAGPFGSAVGETSPDVTLLDCDGGTHSLHDLCERRVAWIFEYADWCPPCRAFAMSNANAVYDDNVAAHGAEFEGWMVISETSSFSAPTTATCAAVRDRYGIHMPVLIDTTGALQTALGVAPNEVQILLDRGARVRWVGHYASGEVAAQIDAAFAP